MGVVIAVITPTVGGEHLEECVASCAAAAARLPAGTATCEHWIVVDGQEHLRAVQDVLRRASETGRDDPLYRQHLMCLPLNTGGSCDGSPYKYNGHRIYAALPWLVGEHVDWVCYLDEDNAFCVDHLSGLLEAVLEAHDAHWAHSFRCIVDRDGTFVCRDTCESLGLVSSTVMGAGDRLVDTSCYMLKRKLALAATGCWDARARDPDKEEVDRALARALMSTAGAPGCVSRRFSVRYRAGSGALSVTPSFFLAGNARMPPFDPDKKDVYVLHFSALKTQKVFFKAVRDEDAGALEEWQPTLWKGLARDYNLVDGFASAPHWPRGAVVVATMCVPHWLPLDLLKGRTDCVRILYTSESANIRHQSQWSADFLRDHFSHVLTHWEALLAAPPPGLDVRVAPHNTHHVTGAAEYEALARRNTAPPGSRGIGMVLEARDLEGQFEVNGVRLTCLDPLRLSYAKGLRDIKVHGQGWAGRVEAHKLGSDGRDPRRAVDILSEYAFALVVENVDAEGYCSEKVYDALLAGAVPLWHGRMSRRILEATGLDCGCFVDVSWARGDGARLQEYVDGMSDERVAELKARVAASRRGILVDRVGSRALAASISAVIRARPAEK